MTIRIGTRGSALARAQTGGVVRRLRGAGLYVEEVVIETRGDRDTVSAFPEFGGAGVFVREIEEALLDGRIDAAVHSYKDLPSDGPEDLIVAAVAGRLDPADHLLIRRECFVPAAGRLPLPAGARVGTASARRQALLLHERDDLAIAPLRGNVDTRVRLLLEGRYDAVVLAGAGVRRLQDAGALGDMGSKGIHDCRLGPEWFVPAPAQGALAVQVRRSDRELAAAVGALEEPEAALVVGAERRLLAGVEGSCDLPFGAWCRRVPGTGFALTFALGDGERLLRDELSDANPLVAADRACEHLRQEGVLVR